MCSVWRRLHDTGVGPGPAARGLTWRPFLRARAKHIVAVDLVHIDAALLERRYALVLIEHGTRRPPARRHRVAHQCMDHPGCRNALLDPDLGEHMTQVNYLICDRDSHITTVVDAVFEEEGIQIVRKPGCAPWANAICERLIGALRRELLDTILILHEDHTRRVLTECKYH